MKNSLIFIFCLFSVSRPSFANEAPAAGPAVAAPPWAEAQSRMLGYKAQRNQLLNNMKKLKEEQAHLPMGSIAMKQNAAEIVKLYKEYKEMTEEYNRLLVLIKYRYPERLAKDEVRSYKTEEVPSLEQMEAELDLDGRLNRTLGTARRQYGSSQDQSGDRQPSSVPGPENQPRDTIREQDPIILGK